ncbi:RNA-guided endonuclease InsQ/TnpB family protein [Streptomyces prasinus]
MDAPAEKPEPVRDGESRHVKREILGIADRRKHHTREMTPLRAHVKEPDARHRVYRFRFYPNAEQVEQLSRTFGACRWVFNEGLALRSQAWEQHRVRVGFAETCRALTGWKRAEKTTWLKEVSSTVLQQSLRHLDQAFSRFLKGETKLPRQKRKGRSRDTATYVRTGFSWVEDDERPGTGLLKLAKQTRPLAVRWSRALPAGTAPLRLSVVRDPAGRYFVSVLVEELGGSWPPAFVPGSQEPKAVGLDLGLVSLVTLDDGTKVGHQKLLKRHADKLARLQRELHRKVKGSKNREKARRKIACLYARIRDVRKDMLDQLTTHLVRENQVLVVEDLSVATLMRGASGKGGRRKTGLITAIRDAAWGELLRQLAYKCEWYGRTLVMVDRFFPSTRRCSACHVKGSSLHVSVRHWSCAACGAVHDRDVNAAVNLRDEGMRLYWLAEASLPPDRTMPRLIRASAVKEAMPAA